MGRARDAGEEVMVALFLWVLHSSWGFFVCQAQVGERAGAFRPIRLPWICRGAVSFHHSTFFNPAGPYIMMSFCLRARCLMGKLREMEREREREIPHHPVLSLETDTSS